MASLAELPNLVGFFSYSRNDDEGDDGAVLSLANRIYRELRSQLGRTDADFKLWRDKDALAAGEHWKEVLKDAFDESVFFIMMVSPSALRSDFCRFEFESFIERERVLGRSDLVFPILYITVPELDAKPDTTDPVISIVKDRQYVDWRPIRYLDVNSTEVKQTVGQFCSTISRKLRLPWISPEERQAIEEQKRAEEQRRLQEAEAKRQAQEHERQRLAEAKSQAKSERLRKEAERTEQKRQRDQEEREKRERKAQELEAKRKADEERKRREAQQRKAQQSLYDAGTTVSDHKDSDVPLWKVILFPWYRVQTVEQARLLTIIGAAFLGLIALTFLIRVGIAPPYMWVGIMIFFGCAVGTYLNSRIAAVLGFVAVALHFTVWFYAVPPSVNAVDVLILATVLMCGLATFDGIRGTSATSRLRGQAEEYPQQRGRMQAWLHHIPSEPTLRILGFLLILNPVFVYVAFQLVPQDPIMFWFETVLLCWGVLTCLLGLNMLLGWQRKHLRLSMSLCGIGLFGYVLLVAVGISLLSYRDRIHGTFFLSLSPYIFAYIFVYLGSFICLYRMRKSLPPIPVDHQQARPASIKDWLHNTSIKTAVGVLAILLISNLPFVLILFYLIVGSLRPPIMITHVSWDNVTNLLFGLGFGGVVNLLFGLGLLIQRQRAPLGLCLVGVLCYCFGVVSGIIGYTDDNVAKFLFWSSLPYVFVYLAIFIFVYREGRVSRPV